MIYEVRTYTLRPGQIAEFEKRFEDSLSTRLKYSELAAFWHTEIGPLNQVIHVWPYEDLKQRTEIRAASSKEANWPPKVSELILSMESQIFIPAPFSPKLGGGQKLGNIYEMRIYQYQPGSIPTVLERWDEALKGGRLDLSPLAAGLYSDIGQLNVWVHIWPYADLNQRAQVREKSRELSTWPPKTREFIMGHRPRSSFRRRSPRWRKTAIRLLASRRRMGVGWQRFQARNNRLESGRVAPGSHAAPRGAVRGTRPV